MSVQPLKRRQKICVAIPASIVSDVPHLREKTFKIGLIGRALAIFRIDEVMVYPDFPQIDQSRETKLISTILSYMETPQYIRKKLFGLMPELRYAGILPPLRTPHHPTQSRMVDLKTGEFRDGVVVKEDESGALIDIGVEKPILAPNARLRRGSRVTVKVIEEGGSFRAKIVNPDDIPVYWGYKVIVSRSPLGRAIKEGHFDMIIATSRRGDPFMKVKDSILDRWWKSNRILIAFGSPTEGLQEIVKRENFELSELADFIVNTIPKQATETVRTEEAIYATLAIINILTESQ